MAKNKGGSFGSRKGVRTPPVMVQGNTMRFSKDPSPWFADFDSLAAQCTSLTTSPGILLNFINDAELMAKVDRDALNTSILAMNELILKEKTRLKDLKEETRILREGAPADGDKPAREAITRITQDNTIPLLDHGEQFQLFMNDWVNVIYFALDECLQHFRAVGAEIPVLCPRSPGFFKTEGTMTADELKKAQEISLTELQRDERDAQEVVEIVQAMAGRVKRKHYRHVAKGLGIPEAHFEALVKGNHALLTSAQLKDVRAKLDAAIAAVPEDDLPEDEKEAEISARLAQPNPIDSNGYARGMRPEIVHVDEAPFLKSE